LKRKPAFSGKPDDLPFDRNATVGRLPCAILAFRNGDAPIRRNVLHNVDRTADPPNFYSIRPLMPTQAEVKAQTVVTLIASSAVHFIHLDPAACHHPDMGADPVSVGPHASETDLKPVIPVHGVIPQDGRLPPRIQNHNVRVAVIVQIIQTRPAAA
jgi:hypothetical protein